MSRSDDDAHRFVIDPTTGYIRTATNFLYSLGNVFGFDVKATDRGGAEDGKSTISNVFVSIISSVSFNARKVCGFQEEEEKNSV